MGLFGSKTKAPALTKGRTLKKGATVPLVDVEPGFVDWARAAKPATESGHLVTVRVQPLGENIIVMAGDGSVVGRMDDQRAAQYRDEFAWMAQRGEYGIADVAISREGSSRAHMLLVNYDQHCRDGGVI